MLDLLLHSFRIPSFKESRASSNSWLPDLRTLVSFPEESGCVRMEVRKFAARTFPRHLVGDERG